MFYKSETVDSGSSSSTTKQHKKNSSDSSKASLPSQSEFNLSCPTDGSLTEKTSFFPLKIVKENGMGGKVGFGDSSAASTPVSDDSVDTVAINGESKQEHNKLSLAEFEINKIWFSFPEPPISPKGKRKIPYTRFDWNLLSSVSPAVTSWLCASKHAMQPLKVCFIFI